MSNPYNFKWSDENITTAIMTTKDALNLDRMPTRTELKEVIGSTGILSAIQRRGGMKVWGEKLGYPITRKRLVKCCDCGNEFLTDAPDRDHWRCKGCRRKRKNEQNRKRYAALAMHKPMDYTTALILVRAMEGRRHQTVAELAQELHRNEDELKMFIDRLHKTGEWGRIWAELQRRDKEMDLYQTAIC